MQQEPSKAVHTFIRPASLAMTLATGLLTAQTAQAVEVTPLLGFRGGGEFVDTVENKKHITSSSETFGLIIGGEPYDRGKRFEVYFSHQSTEISSINIPVETAPSNIVDVPLKISYLHFGGTAPISDDDKMKTFVSGGLGFTYLSPDFTGLESDLLGSLSIGLGLRMPMSERISLRLETRLLATLVNSNSTILCSGGCTIRVNGSAYYQGEVFAGISFGF